MVSERLSSLCVSDFCQSLSAGNHRADVQDTAMLFAAVESDPKAIPAPIKTSLSLEDLAWSMFPQDQLRSPVLYGNAGNDAFVSLPLYTWERDLCRLAVQYGGLLGL